MAATHVTQSVRRRKMKRPKRVIIYSVVLGLLALLYLVGCVMSWESQSEIINALRFVRIPLFIACAFILAFTSYALLNQKAWSRLLVALSFALHYAYIIYYNIKVLNKDGTPEGVELVGFAIGMSMLLMIMIAICTPPFTPKFKAYIKKTGEYSGQRA